MNGQWTRRCKEELGRPAMEKGLVGFLWGNIVLWIGDEKVFIPGKGRTLGDCGWGEASCDYILGNPRWCHTQHAEVKVKEGPWSSYHNLIFISANASKIFELGIETKVGAESVYGKPLHPAVDSLGSCLISDNGIMNKISSPQTKPLIIHALPLRSWGTTSGSRVPRDLPQHPYKFPPVPPIPLCTTLRAAVAISIKVELLNHTVSLTGAGAVEHLLLLF